MTETMWDHLLADEAFASRFRDYNDRLGGALEQLPEQPQDIQGRAVEIAQLHAVLERPRTPVALLLGEAGVGKTALVEQFVKDANAGALGSHVENEYLVVAVRVGKLSSIGNTGLQSALATLFDDLAEFERMAQETLNKPNLRLIVFIDEIHMIVTIFGPGTKIGGDVMKDILARSPIRIIGATTRREYDSTIAVDQPLAQRFKPVEMNELCSDIVIDVCKNWWSKIAPNLEPLAEDIIRDIIEANRIYRSDMAEPRKSLDVLEDLVSYGNRTGEQPTSKVVVDTFRRRWNIQLDFEVDADSVYREIEKRIIGQPYALYTLRRQLRSMMFQLEPFSNRPFMSALMTGATGTGKTETTKAIADTLYPGQPVLLNINVPDYKEAVQEPDFRRRVGEFVRHTPNAVVLMDEVEKGSPALLDTLLAMLDEGNVTFTTTNREGRAEVNNVSLRNTIIVATTNQGQRVFEDDARFSSDREDVNGQRTRVDKAQVGALMNSLLDNLKKNGFRPELLGRFDRIVPYRGLSEPTLLRITERELSGMAERFRLRHGIEVVFDDPRQWDKARFDHVTFDVALFIVYTKVKAADSSRGGARAIRSAVRSEVQDSIIDAVTEHRQFTRFHVGVSRDNAIYTVGATPTEGEIIVTPITD